MAIIQGNAKQGSTRGFYNFPIEQSLRFNDDDSAYLTWTPASAGNRKTWTWSGWVKRSNVSTASEQMIFAARDASGVQTTFYFTTADKIQFYSENGGGIGSIATTAVYRDPSAWYHIVFRFDAVNTSLKIYVNGVEQTLSVFTAVSNTDHAINSTITQGIGYSPTSGQYADFYLAEVNFIDGTALDADSFGELKNGVWIPKDPSGLTYGTNGFRLSFADDAEVEAFNTVLYRGTQSKQSITGYGFSPDLVWIKNRSSAVNHYLVDQVRGATKALFSNSTAAEDTDSQSLQSFDSDGFTLGNSYGFNASGDSYVAWGWKAGNSNVSNTDGSITSTVRANTTYGFSVVSYTGTGSAATIGHGLSSAPDFVIIKNRDSTQNWYVFHESVGATKYLLLDSTVGEDTSSTVFNNTAPSTSVVTLGSWVGTNAASNNMIAYCWAEKAGYSKFGSYEGNNTATGPTVTTTFKPALVIIKNADGTGNWNLFDNTRATFPDNDLILRANLSAAEVDGSGEGGDAYEVEFTDTGFIPKASGASSRSQVNGTGTYIYAAFADTREAAFWLDQTSNDNDWQPVNLDHNDTVADSPTDNFATWNPLIPNTGTFADGNLSVTTTVDKATSGTVLSSAGKHYCEIICTSATTIANARLGITNADGIGTALGGNANTWAYLADGRVFHNSSSSSYGTTLAVNDVFQIALDIDAGKVWYGINGTWMASGDPTAGTNPSQTFTANQSMTFAVASGSGTFTFVANFGQQPFKYDPPA